MIENEAVLLRELHWEYSSFGRGFFIRQSMQPVAFCFWIRVQEMDLLHCPCSHPHLPGEKIPPLNSLSLVHLEELERETLEAGLWQMEMGHLQRSPAWDSENGTELILHSEQGLATWRWSHAGSEAPFFGFCPVPHCTYMNQDTNQIRKLQFLRPYSL